MSCVVRGLACQREEGVEYRVNISQDPSGPASPGSLPACCLVEACYLTRNARTWPNGKPKRWIERREVTPWEAQP